MRPRLALAALLAAVALSGCGGSGGELTTSGPPPDASAELEAIIERQLPKQARQVAGGAQVFVRRVGCLKRSGTDYECLATLQIIEGYDVYDERLPITGTCNSGECIWRVTG